MEFNTMKTTEQAVKKPTRISFDKWFTQYRPVKNHLDPDAAYDGCMFETFGNEVKFVQASNARKVWTLLDCDGKLLIVDGFHWVNRLGYFISEIQAPDNRTFTIKA